MKKSKSLYRIIWVVFLLIISNPAVEQESVRIELSKTQTDWLHKNNKKFLSNADWTKRKISKSSVYNPLSEPNDVYWDDRFDQLGVTGFVVNALAVNGTEIFVGGNFTSVGGLSANNIAKWDGNNWSVLGSGSTNGVNGTVNAIAVSGSDVYVGGTFTTAAGVTASNIAKWDGNNWSALGSGIVNWGDVRAIATVANDVYVGGFFITAAGGENANNIVKWDGSNWSALGSGPNNGVNSLVSSIKVHGSIVYVGGSFTLAGGGSANNLASWNSLTNSWSPLGSGVNLDVNAMVINENDVYVGGIFTAAGGTSVKKIARWDGNTWSALGSGISGGEVNAMTIIGSDLYVGGSFTTAGDVGATKIAKWNGSSWSALGSGIEGGPVFSAATCLNDLYVGGSFNTAGGKPSNRLARWNEIDGSVPVELISFKANPKGHQIELLWTTATEQNNFGFELERMVIDSALYLNRKQSKSNQWQKIAFIQGHGTTTEPHRYSYIDNVQSLIHNSEHIVKYRLKQIDLDGTFKYSQPVEVLVGVVPDNIMLRQNYPNPFNPETTIEFVIPKDGLTTLKVYNMLGQEVQTLINQHLKAGVVYKVKFNGSALPSGMYVSILRTENPLQIEKNKMLLLK